MAKLTVRVQALVWPAGVFALALLLRLVDLGSRPFWLDEIFTYNRASLSPTALVLDSFQNHHMPSFFLLLSPLTHLPHPEFWLRLPSAIFGALAVVLVFLIAARISNRLGGVMAGLILAFSPTMLGFAQEARSYTLVMTLILVALYGVTRLVQNWRGDKTGWLCYIFGTAGALMILGDSLPWLIAANLIFLVLLAFTTERKRFLYRFLGADAVILALTLPFYLLMLHFQSQSVTTSLGWIPPLSLSRIWYNFGAVYLMHLPDWVSFRLLTHHAIPGVVWLLDLLLLCALGAGIWRLRRQPTMLITQLLAFLFLPCLFLLISLTHPILLPRYLLWSAAPFAILAGIGIATLIGFIPRRAGRSIAALGVAALLLLNLLPYYKTEIKPRWDVAAQLLSQEVEPGDVVLFSDPGVLPILQLYLPVGAQATILGTPYASLPDLQQALRHGHNVWVVYGHAGQNTSTRKGFFAGLQPLGAPAQLQQAGKRITIALYQPDH